MNAPENKNKAPLVTMRDKEVFLNILVQDELDAQIVQAFMAYLQKRRNMK